MRFYLLHEARKATNRSRIKQHLDYEYRGVPTQEIPYKDNSPWPQKVAQIFKDRGLSGPQHKELRRRIMGAFRGVAGKKGNPYLQRMSVPVLEAAIKKMARDYDLQKSRPTAHTRPGVSGVYDLETHPGVHVGPARRTRMNLGDIEEPHRIPARELRGHYHPDLRHIGQAIDNTTKPDYKKDKAVVHDLEGIPYYIFIKPYKTAPAHVSGTNKFAPMLPTALNFKNTGLTDTTLTQYYKSTKWDKIMDSESYFALEPPKVYKNLEEAIVVLQNLAWEKAYDWFQIRQNLAHWNLELERLDKKEQELKRRTGEGLSKEDEDKHTAAYEHARASARALVGKSPEPDKMTGERHKFINSYSNIARKAKEAFTWYVWLMAAEHEYGMAIPERKKLFPGYPTTATKTKRHRTMWAIQPPKESENYKWDMSILKGLNYHKTDWDRFVRHLQKSNYNFVSSDDEIQRLWVPLVGKLRDKFGLKLHPQNIADYLAHSKLVRSPEGVVGRKSNKLHIRASMQTPMYLFKGGTQNREFALLPAVGYLQYFDSPFHGGERLIQGRKKFSLPVARNLTRKSGSSWNPQTQNKMKLRSAAYRERKRATGWKPKTPRTMDRFDHESLDAKKQRADIIAAERILQLRKREEQRAAKIAASRGAGSNVPHPLGGTKHYGYQPVPQPVVLNKGLSPVQRRALKAQAKAQGMFVGGTRYGGDYDVIRDNSFKTKNRSSKGRTSRSNRTSIAKRRIERKKKKRAEERRIGFRRD